MQDRQQEIEGAEVFHGRNAIGHHRFVAGKQVEDLVAEQQQQGPGAKGVAHPHGHGHSHPALHAVQLACAEILAHKGGGRHAEAHHRQDVETVNLHVRRKARHGRCTVAVHAGLHQHVGEGDDHVLDAGGQADADDAARHLAVGPDVPQRHAVIRLHPGQKPQRQHAGHQLADIGGKGRALHAHLQHRDEHQVQNDVRARRAGQIDERALGVACRIQDARRHVVHHAEQHAAEVDLHISHSVLQHLRRGVHPHQQAAGDQNAADGQHQAQDARNGKRGVHRDLRVLPVLRAQILRHHNARAHGHALAEPDQQKDGRPAGAHRGQRVAAQKVAHNDGVGGVVQLLKQVAQDQRHREQQDVFPDAALRHHPRFSARRFGGLWHDILLFSSFLTTTANNLTIPLFAANVKGPAPGPAPLSPHFPAPQNFFQKT